MAAQAASRVALTLPTASSMLSSAGVQHEVRVGGQLIRRVDPGHSGKASRARARVKALGVPLLTQRQGRIDEDLDERQVYGGVQGGGFFTVARIRADEPHDRDRPGLGEQARHVGGPAHVLGSCLFAEPQVPVEPVA